MQVLKDSLPCKERVGLMTNKAMIWETKNDDIEVQTENTFETLLTKAPARANAQETSYKIWS